MADQLQAEIGLIRSSSTFLSAWYLLQHREVALRGEDGVSHFCQIGWREGAKPNPYFDTEWYLQQNPDIAAAGVNPLVHYIAFGEAEGRNPCSYFDVAWYRATYGLGARELCLKHFLERRLTGQVSPVPVFDAGFYLENNPDVAEAGADPFEHFLAFGVSELRDPAPDFDIKFYLNRYRTVLNGQNPLLHYLANRESGVFLPKRWEHEALMPGVVRRTTRPAPEFETFQPVPGHAARRAKLLAFYLPQFHAIPENDAWWGKGFTDWTNLARALPRFAGHLQPRVPRDLGYYSLDDPETLRRQIDLATGAGLSGFVFYFYWFNRHRLLEKPLEQLLGDASLDFPFCVMWANENWTRRWDGMEREVLIAQEYLESDDIPLIACFARLFADRRHIRVQDRPLLMIYRPGLIPDARRRIAKWRQMFETLHGEKPLIVMAQSLGEDYDPEPYGLDGAVEFPPHKLSQALPDISGELTLLDPDFSATVHDYAEMARISLSFERPDYPLIKTIVPGWDNDPRREGAGLVLHGPSPAKYQEWLENLVADTEKHPFHGERIICVNAWNEWAEGAFLEPDTHFGAAFLNATGRAICGRNAGEFGAGILLIGHDAQPHGAQLLLLHLARHFRRQCGMEVHLLLLGVGPLLGDYYLTANVRVANDKTVIGQYLDAYRGMGFRAAIVNSAASARIVPWLKNRGIASTLLIHEMPQLLREYNLEIQARLGAAAAKNRVFSSELAAERFHAAVDLARERCVILPQGNYQNMSFDAAARARTRQALGIAAEAFLVLGAGFGDLRKGFDLFLQVAGEMLSRRGDVHFLWVGDIQFALKTYLAPEMAQAEATGRFHHRAFTAHIREYFSAADVFALPSREDPFPTVALEALARGMPCVAFGEAGGIPELLRELRAGRAAKPGDRDDFLAQLEALLDHRALEQGRAGLAETAAKKFDFAAYAGKLLRLAEPEMAEISVAVINYNYAHYLPERLRSIFAQTYPVCEVLLLDDASTDESLRIAGEVAAEAKRDMRVIANAENSGSVFAQWRRAAEAAKGEYLWLCEADDAAEPGFLETLANALQAAENPLLGFTDSRAIDAEGKPVSPSYRSYYFASGAMALGDSGIWPGRVFAAKMLGIRNLILNVSAVLWRREALLRALARVPDIDRWRLAGDWRLYLAALAGEDGDVVYVAEPLNVHRRHGAGMTQRLDREAHLAEIAEMHRLAAESLGLDAAAKAAQSAYLEQLSGQFRTAAKNPQRIVARKRKV